MVACEPIGIPHPGHAGSKPDWPISIDNEMFANLDQILRSMQEPIPQGILLFTAVLITIVVAAYFLINWRDRNRRMMSANEHLAEFREIHRRGMISDSEFRIIKGQLGTRIVEELAYSNAPDKENLTKIGSPANREGFASR